MYQAHLHPEQYSNTFNDEQIKRLHDAMMYVCDTAVAANGDSDEFPKDWLMKHRWGKGKKDGSKLPNGDKITFLKVGGRTSAIVPSRQKKTAAVAGDVSEGAEEDDIDGEEEAKPKKGTKRTAKAAKKEEATPEDEAQTPAKPKRGRQKVEDVVKEEAQEVAEEVPAAKKQKTAAIGASKRGNKAQEEGKSDDVGARRRSTRLSK
jgi:formamidopyrimidine-DNA glycosylase